ncbi:MAG TPA: type II toxin-antitoxin system prevent-host-death family antitoxin [Longimicrobiales bacterium]|nr:type II toxin-antitoxin system prevent-host-death family antitoxin [Longimicrobiales bacterium]
MRTVGIRELKARLSEYLRAVGRGEVVLVTDRNRVVAELRPPGSGDTMTGDAIERAVLQLATSGDATLPVSFPAGSWRPAGAGLPAGTAARVLGSLREDRGM